MALLSLERRSTDSSVACDLDSFLLRLLHPMLRPSGCFIFNSSECRPDSSFGTEDYFSPVPLLHHSHHCQDPAAMPPHFYQGTDMGSSNFTSVRTNLSVFLSHPDPFKPVASCSPVRFRPQTLIRPPRKTIYFQSSSKNKSMRCHFSL